jgi:hypothetical protein
VTHERRLAGAREAHDYVDLARADVQAHIVQADVAAGLREHVGLALAAPEQVEHARVAGIGAEQLVHVLYFYRCHVCLLRTVVLS